MIFLGIAVCLYVVLYAAFAVYTWKFDYREPLEQPLRFREVSTFLSLSVMVISLVLVGALIWQGRWLLAFGAFVLLFFAHGYPGHKAKQRSEFQQFVMNNYYAALHRADQRIGGGDSPLLGGPVTVWTRELSMEEERGLAFIVTRKRMLSDEPSADALLETIYRQSLAAGQLTLAGIEDR